MAKTQILSSYLFETNNIGKDFLEYLKLRFEGTKIIIAVPASTEDFTEKDKKEHERLSQAKGNFLMHENTKYVLTGEVAAIYNDLPDKGKNGGPQALTDPGRIKTT